jgi:hypothetical protein
MKIVIQVTNGTHIEKLLQGVTGQGYQLEANRDFSIGQSGMLIEFTLNADNQLHRKIIATIFSSANSLRLQLQSSAPEIRRSFEEDNIPSDQRATWERISGNLRRFTQFSDYIASEIKENYETKFPEVSGLSRTDLQAWMEAHNFITDANYSYLQTSNNLVERCDALMNSICGSKYVFQSYTAMMDSKQSHLSSTAQALSLLSPPHLSSVTTSTAAAAAASESKQSQSQKDLAASGEVKKQPMRLINDFMECDAHYFHGIGFDITKLMLINRNGILTAAEGEQTSEGLFAQSHGVTAHSSSGGINKKEYISVSKFTLEPRVISKAFTDYSKTGISLMIPKTGLNQEVRDGPRGGVPGEANIKGSIPLSKVSAVCVDETLLHVKISDVIGRSIISGSSDTPYKCTAFFNRVNDLFRKQDIPAQTEMLQMAKQIDELYSKPPTGGSNPIERKALFDQHKATITDLENQLCKKLGQYFDSISGRSLTVNDCLTDPTINRFPPIEIKKTAYNPPMQSPSPLPAPSAAAASTFKAPGGM